MDLGTIDICAWRVLCRGLEKHGFVDQNRLERDLSTLMLRALAVSSRQQSDSIGIALALEQGSLMNRFDIGRHHFL